jgi:hypothetical protein
MTPLAGVQSKLHPEVAGERVGTQQTNGSLKEGASLSISLEVFALRIIHWAVSAYRKNAFESEYLLHA